MINDQSLIMFLLHLGLSFFKLIQDNWATTWDFQQCGILTTEDSDKPVQPPFKLRNSKWCLASSLTLIGSSKRLAKALISLCVCAGWSEPLLVTHTTLLEISCPGSYYIRLAPLGLDVGAFWWGFIVFASMVKSSLKSIWIYTADITRVFRPSVSHLRMTVYIGIGKHSYSQSPAMNFDRSAVLLRLKMEKFPLIMSKQEGPRALVCSHESWHKRWCIGLWRKRHHLKIFLFSSVVAMLFSWAKHSDQFGRRHYEEHFCEIILNLNQWLRRII